MVHEKSPTQHMADLLMLEKKASGGFAKLFDGKDTEYVHVDGATDAGPSHTEVQFLWSERHLKKGRVLTMITARCSGDSHFNRY